MESRVAVVDLLASAAAGQAAIAGAGAGQPPSPHLVRCARVADVDDHSRTGRRWVAGLEVARRSRGARTRRRRTTASARRRIAIPRCEEPELRSSSRRARLTRSRSETSRSHMPAGLWPTLRAGWRPPGRCRTSPSELQRVTAGPGDGSCGSKRRCPGIGTSTTLRHIFCPSARG